MTITLSNLPNFVAEFVRSKMRENGFETAEDFVTALLKQEAARSPVLQTPTDQKTQSANEDRSRLQNIQEDLYRKGLLAGIQSSDQVSDLSTFEPIEFDGPPISQTVIEDRR